MGGLPLLGPGIWMGHEAWNVRTSMNVSCNTGTNTACYGERFTFFSYTLFVMNQETELKHQKISDIPFH
jgi:hypothetical protein